jgi:protein-L-isoaspartate(D-aspartate) O-methyltransferase
MSEQDFPQSRRFMVDSQLRTSGINQAWILAAMGKVPRELFVPTAMRAVAYMDRSIAISASRKLNPAVATGGMLSAADINDNDRILLIGAGTGYVATLLASRAAHIVAVEEDAELFAQASAQLSGLDNINLIKGPLTAGAADHGPFSLIVIDGAIADLPQTLVDQLSETGRVVTGLTDGANSRLAIGYRRGGTVALKSFADTEIAALPGFTRKAEFVF